MRKEIDTVRKGILHILKEGGGAGGCCLTHPAIGAAAERPCLFVGGAACCHAASLPLRHALLSVGVMDVGQAANVI